MNPDALSPAELRRYSRHLNLPGVGVEGQQRLKAARVAVIGAGGLGSPVALYLAAAGVGHLDVIDFDVVDETNLQRQVAHRSDRIGQAKTESARSTMLALNPLIQVTLHNTRLSAQNAIPLLTPCDVVVDGSDNFATRYLANDACVLLGKPYVYGSVYQFEGQASVFHAKEGPCYRCLYPNPPPPGAVPDCNQGGVLGVLPGLIGMIQATETIKLLLHRGQSLAGRLLIYQALDMTFREIRIAKDPACPVCGTAPTIENLQETHCACASTPGTAPGRSGEISPAALKQALQRGTKITLLDVREPYEVQICRLPDSVHIPLGELPRRVGELSPADHLVVYCRSGGRSARAVEWLKQAGFERVLNLAGGILAWSDQVDPSLPKY